MLDFYRLRGAFAHGKKQDTRPSLWSLYEHLLLSSYVFPLTVKCLLQKQGFYTLTNDDLFDIDIFEQLADADFAVKIKSDKHSLNVYWTEIRSTEGLRRKMRKISLL